MLIHLNDILTLNSVDRYIVMAGVAYEKSKYYYLLKVDENNCIVDFNARIMKEKNNPERLELQDVVDMKEKKMARNLLNISFDKLYCSFL